MPLTRTPLPAELWANGHDFLETRSRTTICPDVVSEPREISQASGTQRIHNIISDVSRLHVTGRPLSLWPPRRDAEDDSRMASIKHCNLQ